MSWTHGGGRKSEDGRAASSLANSQIGGSSHTTAATATGGGIFSFLKTELDSFVKGLSGKADCLQPEETQIIKQTPNPPRKKLKRSHEPKKEQPTYAEVKAYERELDEIRQHTSKRFTDQDYYAPLTEANLQASTSKLQDMDPSSSTLINRDRRSQETREIVEAYSSYYTDEPVPQVPSPHTNLHAAATVTESVEKRRRKRERAATFINDEEAKQAVARQIAEEEARLKAAEARAIDHRRTRERDARDLKRRQDRADALARLEAQQVQEDADRARLAPETEIISQAEQDRIEYEARQSQKQADELRRAAREHRRRQQLEAEAKRQEDAAAKEEEARLREAMHLKQKEQEEADKAREEQAYRLRRQQRENARRTRDLENAEKERTQAIKDASESKRIRELEAEVQRLRNELQEAKRMQEEAAALSASVSRHVHFAPTPPASDGHRGEMSFLSMNSASSTSLRSLSRAPPPPAPPPPPPPMASMSNSTSLKSAKASPLALLAAHRASVKSSEGTSKKRPSGINAAVGMPADMGKFLSEMKNTKLRKVGMPVEGAKKPRDEEETGLKSILEGVLKRRFLGDKDRTSGSTRTSSIPTLSNNSQTSISTGDESITSFSSYRPPDWSMEMDSSPFPPVRSSSLRRPQGNAAGARQASSTNTPAAGVTASTSTSILPRTLSQPQLAKSQSQSQRDSTASSLRRSQSLAKMHPRPQASFGHAITCEEPAPPSRQRTQVYVSGHHRQSSQSTPLQRPPSDFVKHRRDSIGINEPSTSATMRTRQSSDQTMTGRSIRSIGSSFDIELYTQMQLQEDNDSLEEEMRRSYSNPPLVDGSMDFASPPARHSPVEASSLGERLKTRSHYQIPALTFRQPAFSFSPGSALPAPRPHTEGGRKVSYYTHPRSAPEPPAFASEKGKLTENSATWSDASGRPLSPSKSRAKLKASRAPLQSLSTQALDDDESILLPYLTEEQANGLLAEDDNSITGYGVRTN